MVTKKPTNGKTGKPAPKAKTGAGAKAKDTPKVVVVPLLRTHNEQIKKLQTGDTSIEASITALETAHDARLDVLEAQVSALNTNTQPNRIKGNNTGSAAPMADLTPTQVTAMLDVMAGSGAGRKKGLVPDPPASGGSKLYLREDATWADVLAVAANVLLGNNTGGAATAIGLTPAQVTAMLDVFVSGLSPLKGLVPAPPSGASTGKVLSAAGWIDSSAAGMTTANALTLKGNNTGVTAAVSDLNPSQVRALLGLVIGTDVQAWSANLDALAAQAATAYGRGLLNTADATALRAALGLVVGTNVQAWSANLDALAAQTATAYGRGLLNTADAAALRAALALVVGTNVQAQDATLEALAGLSSAANKLAYFTGVDTADLTDLTAFARALLGDADAAAMRTRLTLGTAALGNTPATAKAQASSGEVVRGDDPRLVAGGRTFKKMAQKGTAMNGGIAITSDDKLVTWGANNSQTVSRIPALGDRPRVKVLNGTKTGEWVACGGSAWNSWGLTSTGELWIDGDNTTGQLGLGDVTNTPLRLRQMHRVTVSGRTFKAIAFSDGIDAASGSFWAIMDNDTLRAWGNNSVGQLGVGDTTLRNTPTAVTLPAASTGQAVLEMVVSCAASASFMCRTADNKIHVTGNNANGQLGLGNTTNQSSLQNVAGETATALMAAGGADSVPTIAGIFQIITPSGTLKGAGLNTSGQLGDNSLTSRSAFTNTSVAHTNVSKLVQPHGNYLNTGYINALNELWLTGAAGSGQLGMGNTTTSQVYVKPNGAFQTKVAQAIITSVATPLVVVRTTDGEVWLAGASTHGQMGLGALTAVNTFTRVFLPEPIVDIAALGAYAATGCAVLALGESGKAYTWGFGTSGLLGQGHLNNMAEASEVMLV